MVIGSLKKQAWIVLLFIVGAEIFGQQVSEKDLMINTFFPGYWQLKRGEVVEGILGMCVWPLTAASGYLLADYLLPAMDQEAFVIENDRGHYLWYSDELASQPDRWKLFTSVCMSAGASLFYIYSTYAAEEDFFKARDPGYTDLYGEKLGLEELLAAPWQGEYVFNFDVFPGFPMFILLSTAPGDFYTIAAFFKRETVPFLGVDMHPLAAFSLALGSSIVLANMSTVAEEVAFRGHLLRQRGLHASSFSFGGAHLGNVCMPNTSIEATALQTVFATLFGYYAGYRTIQAGFDFRRMIALHFWHNVTAMTLDYLLDPDQAMVFSMSADFSF